MKVWTDREGKAVEGKEFISRWKSGIESVTPLQQAKVNIFSYVIIFVGIIWGITVSILAKQYWLTTILVGSFIISCVSMIGILQKYFLLKNLERRFD